MKTKRLSAFFAATVLGLSSILTAGFAPLVHATANDCTWTGATDSNFSTPGNWTTCNSTFPQDGDNLVFDTTSLGSDSTVTNDIVGLTIGDITFSGTGSHSYTLAGNALQIGGNVNDSSSNSNTFDLDVGFTDDATITESTGSGGVNFGTYGGTQRTLYTGNKNLTFTGAGAACGVNVYDFISGGGSIAASLSNSGLLIGANNNSYYTGSFTVSAGELGLYPFAKIASSSGVTVTGGTFAVGLSGDATISVPVTLSGTGTADRGTVNVDNGVGFCSGGPVSTTYTATFSGPLTLNSDVTYGGSYNANFTGALTANGHKFTVLTGAGGKVTTTAGTVTAPVTTVTVAAGDNQASLFTSVGNNVTETIDGQRGDTDVTSGGVLKGSGRVNSLDVSSGGTVAPGHSPGKLTVVTTMELADGAIYQAELKDKADGDFDQIVVGAPTDTTGNDVTLGNTTGPTLNTSLYDGYKISKGDAFEIINNLSQTQVNGTFANLPEGATFTVNGYVFAITYKGGDGNDVVLTAQGVPATPNTGFAVIGSHPLITLGVTIVAAGSILAIAQIQKNRRVVPVRVRARK